MKKKPSIKSKEFKQWCEQFKITYPCEFATFDTKNLYEIFTA